ncbi:hypothetical protein F5Y19DRAFT_428613 [Xylariaceae sp. FL1651]|nr:hypothetical protein F5Y19DRAFT_428613 [Xylariaceae sp. FL1651]
MFSIIFVKSLPIWRTRIVSIAGSTVVVSTGSAVFETCLVCRSAVRTAAKCDAVWLWFETEYVLDCLPYELVGDEGRKR